MIRNLIKKGWSLMFRSHEPERSTPVGVDVKTQTEPLPAIDPTLPPEPTVDQLWARQERLARQIRRIDAELRVITRGK